MQGRLKRILVANGRIRIKIYFRDLPPTTSGVGTDKRKVLCGSTLAFANGGICLVADFSVVAFGTSMVAGKVATMGLVIVISFELMS